MTHRRSWGRAVYRRRWLTLSVSLALLVVTALLLVRGGHLSSADLTRGESVRAGALMGGELPHDGGSSFTLVFSSATLHASDTAFRHRLLAAMAGLRRAHRVRSVLTPYDLPPAAAAGLESRDGRQALAVVTLADDSDTAQGYYPTLRGLVRAQPGLDVLATGDVAINTDFSRLLGADLQRGEYVSLPLALLFLLLVFGTVIAALLPLGVGVFAVLGGLGGVYLLTRVTSVSEYALNIVTLIGLGVAIDYSLFIVTRFREELARGPDVGVEEALARTMATTGRAVLFSGLTVAIGLSGLLFFQGTFLSSIGLAGAIVVLFAILYALTFLPSILALLGRRVNAWQLPLGRLSGRPRSSADEGEGKGLWGGIAARVMRRPVLVLALTVPLILVAGSPFLSLRLSSSGVAALPPTIESYRGLQALQRDFNGQGDTEIYVVVHDRNGGTPLAPDRVGALYDLSRRIAALPDVARVRGPVDALPRLDRAGYQRLYARPITALPAAVQAIVRGSVGRDIAVLTVDTAQPAQSDAARRLVQAIRALPLPSADNAELLVAGQTAHDLDQISLILGRAPLAIAYIVVMTMIVLFLLLGSVVLPIKAVVTDVLSITASFGALVWIFQQGRLHDQFNFTPAPIDPTVPVLLFCVVFGLSMDYEVLLLSRMREVYLRTDDNRRAVAEGLERSGRLITGAAAIMVAVFSAFALASIVILKSIGLGMALAIAVDATVVRALIVPATMRLLGRRNWWAPAPLARLHRRLGLAESDLATPAETRPAAAGTATARDALPVRVPEA